MSSFLLLTHTVMRHFLSEIALGVFEDNHPSDRSLPKLQGVSMLNPQILTMWGDRF